MEYGSGGDLTHWLAKMGLSGEDEDTSRGSAADREEEEEEEDPQPSPARPRLRRALLPDTRGAVVRLRELTEIVGQLARGLQELHSAGFIYLALKSDNVVFVPASGGGGGENDDDNNKDQDGGIEEMAEEDHPRRMQQQNGGVWKLVRNMYMCIPETEKNSLN
jgi:serine/threonine protein kinase